MVTKYTESRLHAVSVIHNHIDANHPSHGVIIVKPKTSQPIAATYRPTLYSRCRM